MQVFGFSYECYVPDANVIYPHVFLSEIPNLPELSRTYRECLNTLRKGFVLKILPESDFDFHRLILRKFMSFLSDIKTNVQRAKTKGQTSQQFVENYGRLLRQRKLFEDEKDCGDLRLYWDFHKLDFAKWMEHDNITIDNIINGLVADKIIEYRDFVQSYKHSWAIGDLEPINNIYDLLKSEKKKGSINPKAHEEDFKFYRSLFILCLWKPCQALLRVSSRRSPLSRY